MNLGVFGLFGFLGILVMNLGKWWDAVREFVVLLFVRLLEFLVWRIAEVGG